MAQYSNKSTRKESSPEDYICIFFPSFSFIRMVRNIAKKKGIVQVQYCAWLSVCHFIVSNTKWSYRGDREMEPKPLTLWRITLHWIGILTQIIKKIWNTQKQNLIVIPFFHLDFWPPGFNPWCAFGPKKRVQHIVILFFTCVYINFWD